MDNIECDNKLMGSLNDANTLKLLQFDRITKRRGKNNEITKKLNNK